MYGENGMCDVHKYYIWWLNCGISDFHSKTSLMLGFFVILLHEKPRLATRKPEILYSKTQDLFEQKSRVFALIISGF